MINFGIACAIGLVALASPAGQASMDPPLTGTIRVDGSSTVAPITMAAAEEFRAVAPAVRVTIGVSGTGGGFKRFCAGETDISNASRPIKAEESAQALASSIEFIELPVAFDGLSVVVNTSNDFVDTLTLDEIKKMFSATGGVKKWNDVRPEWPARPIKFYSPGTDSGTFDYFKEVTVGKDGSIRSDMSVSEDDNVLVRGVSGDKDALGFFGFAYYNESKDQLKLVKIDAGKGAIAPSHETIENGTYIPFSRPLFIYVNKTSASKPEVKAFVEFFLREGGRLVEEVGYVRLPTDITDRASKNFAALRTGTQFLNAEKKPIHGPVGEVYK